jgi:tetratricopeptide (TPR) repeat protein
MAKIRTAQHSQIEKSSRNLRIARIGSLIVIICGLSLTAVCATTWQAASTNGSAATESAERQLEEGRSTLDEGTLIAAKKSFEECLQQNGKNPRCGYDLARAESYLNNAKEDQNDSKAAERWLDAAIESAQRTIAIDDHSSDAHALLGDLYGRKISGMFSGMHYGPKSEAETRRAFELNANNPRAFAVVGRKYLFSPKMFGGDTAKAVESFQKATTLDPHDDEAFVWLAIAYRKAGDSQRSQAALSEALRLNSKSAFARRIQSGKGVGE